MKTVLVIGATGDQGHPLMKRLAAEGFEPIALARRADALKGTPFAHVPVRVGDFETREALAPAMRGVDAVAMHLPFVFDAPTASRWGANITAAAKEAGVEMIVFNTSCFVADYALDLSAHDGRRAVEHHMATSGLAWCSIRPVVFMDNITRVWAKPSIVTKSIFAYPAGPKLKISWICLEDVAAYMVEALKRPAARNRAFTVGGPEALTGDEVAERLSKAAGRAIRFQSLTPDEFASKMSMLVTGSPVVEPKSIYRGMAQFYRWYNTQPSSPLIVDLAPVQSVLDVKPTSFLDWAKRQDWSKA